MLYPIADAHCDYLYGAMEYQWNMQSGKRDQTMTLENLCAGNVRLQFFAAWTDTTLAVPPLEQVLLMIDRYWDMIENDPAFVRLTKDYEPTGDTIATVLSIEGAECLSASPSILRDLYRLGVRAATFTWNSNNELAGAAMGKRPKGLTKDGKAILQEMNRLGMAFDVSHLSDAGVDDALRWSDAPIFASHSNCRALCNVPRALKDEHIREIGRRGGVVGINYYGPQLVKTGVARIDDIVRHIRHAADVAGVEAVCLGSDFDGMTRYPVDLPNPSKLQDLCAALEKAGFTPDETERIAYRNLHDFILRFQ
ncbi:MAG: dipeptidase [Clostridia bacterium]|nr:dipeptidase [Clostridia bacterium]